MLKLGSVTKVKVLFLVLVFVFNFDLFKFSAAILEKSLLRTARVHRQYYLVIFTIQYPVPLFSLCTKSLIAVLKDAKQLSEENGGGPFC